MKIIVGVTALPEFVNGTNMQKIISNRLSYKYFFVFETT